MSCHEYKSFTHIRIQVIREIFDTNLHENLSLDVQIFLYGEILQIPGKLEGVNEFKFKLSQKMDLSALQPEKKQKIHGKYMGKGPVYK